MLSVGYTIDIMSFTLYTNSTDGLTFEPEYGMKEQDRKIETRHRAREANEYSYLYGNYRRWRVPIRYVNSSTRQKVNSWWAGNTRLLFQDDNDTDVQFPVKIMNRSNPIGKQERPYDYEWSGIIELEEF